MSELIQDSAPSAGVAAAGAGPAPASAPRTAEAPSHARGRRGPSRFVLFALAALAGLVLGGLILYLKSSGAPVVEPDVAVGAPAGSAAEESAGAGAAADAGEPAADAGEPGADAQSAQAPAAPPARTTRLSSRDPFAPLIAPKAEPKSATKAAGKGKATKETAEAAQAPAPATAPAPAPAPTPASGGTISALSISPLGTSVTLKLDGEKYEVDEGETFAKNYRLYDIFNANCAGFLYGDRNAVVCQGDSVTIG